MQTLNFPAMQGPDLLAGIQLWKHTLNLPPKTSRCNPNFLAIQDPNILAGTQHEAHHCHDPKTSMCKHSFPAIQDNNLLAGIHN